MHDDFEDQQDLEYRPGGDPAISAQTPAANPTRPITTSLRKGMLGFMLGHEQFTVPTLVRMGGLASRAGFQFPTQSLAAVALAGTSRPLQVDLPLGSFSTPCGGSRWPLSGALQTGRIDPRAVPAPRGSASESRRG